MRRGLAIIFVVGCALAARDAHAEPAAQTLRTSAAIHTNAAKKLVEEAAAVTDQAKQRVRLEAASVEYQRAADDWLATLKADPGAKNVRESWYWLADARRLRVRIALILHGLDPKHVAAPARADIDAATAAAVATLVVTGDDLLVENAAFGLVDIADVDRDLAFKEWTTSGGKTGVEPRSAPKFDADDVSTRNVVVLPMPPVVLASIRARDAYVARVSSALDTHARALDYRFQSADQYYLHGHFAEARARFEPIWKEACGKNDEGYRAWERLITMANIERDAESARKLAEREQARPCLPPRAPTPPVIGVDTDWPLLAPRKKFEAAQHASSPQREALFREAARGYEAALHAKPGDREAPEAAFNGAYAYKQVGEYAKAMALYANLVAEYGSEARLALLEKGDLKTGAAPSLRDYAERVKYINEALEALATAYFAMFDHPGAAKIFGELAANARLPPAARKQAARNALILFASLGRESDAVAARDRFLKLAPSAEEKLEVDYLVASVKYRTWSVDHALGKEAARPLIAFYEANRTATAGGKHLVEAASRIAEIAKADGDPAYATWLARVVTTWKAARAREEASSEKKGILAAPSADYAADAELTLLSDEITKAFDKKPATKRTRAEATSFDARLEAAARTYLSTDGFVFARLRQGMLWDALREGLADAHAANEAGDLAIARYASAIAMAEQAGSGAHLMRARALLARHAERVGEDRVRAVVTRTPDPKHESTMLRWDPNVFASRPGLSGAPRGGERSPLPIAP